LSHETGAIAGALQYAYFSAGRRPRTQKVVPTLAICRLFPDTKMRIPEAPDALPFDNSYARLPASQLALSASIHPFAGLEADEIAEYPMEAKPVARAITVESIDRGADGLIRLPDGPGLGMTVDPARFTPYLVDVEIKVGGRVLYRTPAV
jgi:hypothetical protein